MFAIGLVLFTLTSAACGLAPTAGVAGRRAGAAGRGRRVAHPAGAGHPRHRLRRRAPGDGVRRVRLRHGHRRGARPTARRCADPGRHRRPGLAVDLPDQRARRSGRVAVACASCRSRAAARTAPRSGRRRCSAPRRWPRSSCRWSRVASTAGRCGPGCCSPPRRCSARRSSAGSAPRAARGRAPLVDLGLFRVRALHVGSLAGLTFALVPPSFFFVLALYLQQGRGYRPAVLRGRLRAVGAGYFAAMVAADAAGRADWGTRCSRSGPLTVAVGCGAARRPRRARARRRSSWCPACALVGFGIGLVLVPLSADRARRRRRPARGSARPGCWPPRSRSAARSASPSSARVLRRRRRVAFTPSVACLGRHRGTDAGHRAAGPAVAPALSHRTGGQVLCLVSLVGKVGAMATAGLPRHRRTQGRVDGAARGARAAPAAVPVRHRRNRSTSSPTAGGRDRAHQRGPGDAHSAREWIWRRERLRAAVRPAPAGRAAPARARRSTSGTPPRTGGSPAPLPEAKLIAVAARPGRPGLLQLDPPALGRPRTRGRFPAGPASSRTSGSAAGWAPFWRYLELGRYGEQLAHLFDLCRRASRSTWCATAR